MANLFEQSAQYDDNGNILVNQVTAIENGKFSQTTAGTVSGSIASIYDDNDTTYYQFVTNVNLNADERHLRWDMGSKVQFKNIYVYASLDQSSTTTTTTCTLEGSDDGTTWTVLATYANNSSTEVLFNLLATDVRYRYIQFKATQNSSNDTVIIKMYNIKAIL